MKRVGLAALATFATLFVLELGVRVLPASAWKNAVRFDAPFDWLTYDPILGWKNRAYYEQPGFRINRLGYRGPEINRRKAAGALRVVCIGDSRTFGTLLDLERMRYDNDYASPLGELLRNNVPTSSEVGDYDLAHPSVAGARVIAETIYAKLLEQGWLAGPRKAKQ